MNKRVIYYLLEKFELIEGRTFTKDNSGAFDLTVDEVKLVTDTLRKKGHSGGQY